MNTASLLLPLRSDARPEPSEGTRIVGFDETTSGEIFQALASDTTRAVLTSVYDEPGTASEIAERVDTSLRNAKYHLYKLRDVGLIEVADTWYSGQGNEMKVYAPTNESIVVIAGDESTTSTLRERIKRLLGAIGALTVGSVVVDVVVRVPPSVTFQGDRLEPAPTIALGGWLTPGVLFFVGGLFVLLVVLAWSRWG